MSESTLIVELRLLSGNQKLFNSTGELTNTNQTVKVPFGSQEWRYTVKNIDKLGYNPALTEVLRVYTVKKTPLIDENKPYKYEDVPASDEQFEIVKSELQKILGISDFKSNSLTEDQKRIQELEARLAKMENGQSETKKVDDSDDVEKLRKEYLDLTGKEANGTWGVKGLTKAINEAKEQKQ